MFLAARLPREVQGGGGFGSGGMLLAAVRMQFMLNALKTAMQALK